VGWQRTEVTEAKRRVDQAKNPAILPMLSSRAGIYNQFSTLVFLYTIIPTSALLSKYAGAN
jgi:hypothetical protein